MHRFVFDDIYSSSFPTLYVLDHSTNAGTAREYEKITVPGRSGDLHIDSGRYANKQIQYICVVMSDADSVIDALDAALASKKGYCRLSDSFNPELYYLAQYTGEMSPSMAVKRDAARFSVTFDRKPQKYLLSGEQEISFSARGYLFNPTFYEAKPLIKVTGTGQLTIGNQILTITQNPGNFVIDCETEDAYNSVTLVNYNQYVETSLDSFPVLPSGQTGVAPASGMTVTVIPRWWTI